MTTKQELHELVDDMSEREARLALSEWRTKVRADRDAEDAPGLFELQRRQRGRPTFMELARMPLAEREPYLRAMHFEVDKEELREWEEATIADGLPDDE
ncbi:MAG: hypothetical protein ACRDHF_08025 [Tepidiformaceae bacterium]